MERETLQRNIMRRVYYTYVLRLLFHPVTMHGSVIAVCVFFLTRFVSVPNVIRNVLEVRVGELGSYMYGTLVQTEVWTLILLGGIVLAALSLRIQLRSVRRFETSRMIEV